MQRSRAQAWTYLWDNGEPYQPVPALPGSPSHLLATLAPLQTLPRSYPGHVLLTEDLGVVHGIDDGDWPGKRFSVLGRLPRAEARGCSDTFSGAIAS